MSDERRLDIKLGMDSAQLAADIRTAKEQVRTFSTEVRKADAEMKAFGKSSDGLAKKKQSLTRQFNAEEDQMALLNKAYDDQVAKSGANSKQAMKLERDINNLGAQMAKTQSEIDRVNNDMDAFAESSDGAGDSAVDLYNNISKSNETLKTAESNLKSAESATKLYGTTTDTLSDKLGALGAVQDAQRAKMDALQAAYDREVAKSGQSSEAAQRLSQEMNNLQSAMNNTQGEIDRTTAELSELNAEAPDTAASLDEVKISLQAMIMEKVIDFLSRVGDKLLELGANAIATSADLQAHNALFEQVFENMADGTGGTVDKLEEARGAVQSISEETGIMATALEEGFISMNQQFLSLGMNADDSLGLAERGMILAADAAAAYNVELGDAQSRVQSFIKGNVAGAESVGIFARETTLSAFAIERGYIDSTEAQKTFAAESAIAVEKATDKYQKAVNKHGEASLEASEAALKLDKAIKEQEEGLVVSQREWTNLDESIKQAVRTEYIENAYNLAGVMGQASREAEEWENVNRNLEESQRQLNAALGEAAIEMLIPIVSQLTDLIVSLTESFRNMSPQMKKIMTIIAMVVIGLGKAIPAIMAVVNTLSLASIGATGTSVGFLAMIKSALALIAPFVAIAAAIAAIVAIIVKWDDIMAWGKENWPAVFDPLEKAIESIKTILSGAFEYIYESLTGIFSSVGNIWPIIQGVLADLLGKIKGIIEAYLTPILDFIVENQDLILNTFKQVWTFILFLVRTVVNTLGPIISTAFLAIASTISSILTAIQNIITAVMTVIMNIIKLVMQVITGDWSGAWLTIQTLVSDVLNAIWTIITNVFNVIMPTIQGILMVIFGIFMGIFNGIATFLQGIWDNIGEAVTTAWTFIQNYLVGAIGLIVQNVTEGFNNLKDKTSEIWDNIKEKTSTVWESIKKIIGSVTGTIDNVIQGFQNLWDNVIRIFDGIKKKISDTWESVKGKLSALNPFSAEQKVDVVYDDDPYTPFPAFGPPSPDGPQPFPSTGGMIGSALSAVNASASSIQRGLNSTFNNLNDLYDVPDTGNNNSGSYSSGGRDPYLEILTNILEVLVTSNNKEEVIVMDKEAIARKIYKPLERIRRTADSQGSKLKGEISY